MYKLDGFIFYFNRTNYMETNKTRIGIQLCKLSFHQFQVKFPRLWHKEAHWRISGQNLHLENGTCLAQFSPSEPDSSSSMALKPKSFPGLNNTFSSSAVCVVLTFLSFTFMFSCIGVQRKKKKKKSLCFWYLDNHIWINYKSNCEPCPFSLWT